MVAEVQHEAEGGEEGQMLGAGEGYKYNYSPQEQF